MHCHRSFFLKVLVEASMRALVQRNGFGDCINVHPLRAPPPARPLGFPVHEYLQTLHSFRSPVITIFLLPHLGHRSCLPIYLTSLQPEFKRLALLSDNISF